MKKNKKERQEVKINKKILGVTLIALIITIIIMLILAGILINLALGKGGIIGKAPFYNMEDGSVMTLFKYKFQHQSYPGRVHGGLITAMLDEMGLRALWAYEKSEDTFGVTISLDTKYRRPVPYETELIGKGVIVKNNHKFFYNRIYYNGY